MLDHELSIEVRRPVAEVFDYITAPENFPAWAPYITSASRSPEGPLGVGSRMIQCVRGREVIWTITRYDEDVVCRYEADYFYATGAFTFMTLSTNGGTTVIVRDQGQRTGWYRPLGPVLDRIDRRVRRQQLTTIKQILDGDLDQ